MKKVLHSFLIGGALLAGSALQAQTPVGTLVSDFTVTDIGGTPRSLYAALNAGKTVVIDVSAAWCGPCWSYHTSGALDAFYALHGPAGDNTAEVFWIEGDGGTGGDCLTGAGACTGGTSQGDWVTGASYPILDLTPSQVASFPLDIPYYPVLYVICPNRTVYKSGVAGAIGTLSLLNSYMGDCATADPAANAAIASYTGQTEVCDDAEVKIILQNMGTPTLTSCTISAMVGVTSLGPISWTGSLNTYEYTEVSLGTVAVTGTTSVTVTIDTPDAVAGDNSVTKSLSYNFAPSGAIIVQMVTDRYGSETTWTLKNSIGTTVSSGGPYADMSSTGTTTQPPVNLTLPTDCYTLRVLDSYGDGMCCDWGTGSYSIKYGTTTVLTGGAFVSEDIRNFANDATTSAPDVNVFSGVNIFPNPVSGMAFISLDLTQGGDVMIDISNSLGQTLASVLKYDAPAGDNRFDLDFSSFASGVYFVTVSVGEQTTIAKVIK